MTPLYFQSIQKDLQALNSHASGDDVFRLYLLQFKDMGILEMFCMCLETWKYNIDEENEESMERLTSVITPLKLIWPEDFTLLSLLRKRMGEPRPVDVCLQDFDSVMHELEAKILQSKQQVEGWCRNWIHSSMKHYKYSKFRKMLHFLHLIYFQVGHLYKKSVPLGKQLHILQTKIRFLERALGKYDICYPNGKTNIQFMNFIVDFANSVACLTCLYWAKGDDDEVASEMNIVHFDMSQKFIPYAYHILPLYVGYLKANDLQLASDSFLLGEVVESFVDFFFEHLATVLKDDFLFLRDRLMFLFTFLTDPPCENAEEGDLIRSQIYAILHQEVYLLMSFDEMNEDLCDKKALLSAFMIRTDIANVRQLYRGSSDSWITLEVEKMEHNYFVSIQRELYSIEKHLKGAVMEQIQLYKMELRFLRAFLLLLATWDDIDEEITVKLRSMITSFQGIWGEKEEEVLLAHRLHAIRGTSIEYWHPLAFELQEKIRKAKLEIGAWCINLFQSSFQFKTSTGYKILEFMDSILNILNGLVSNKASETFLFKKQIETLQGKLIFMKNLLQMAVELEEFKMFVQAFANDAACLAFLYWTKDPNAKSASETNSMLFHLLQKIKPSTPNVARLYFGTFSYAHPSDSHMYGQSAFGFVELFLEDLVTHLKGDDFQSLQDNILFLLTFLNDPPTRNAEELICNQTDILFWEGLYSLLPFDDTDEGFSSRKVLLHDFMMKIEAINANITSIYGKFPHSSQYNFPKVISPLFLDFLMQNLRNLKDRMNNVGKYVPFAKYKIIKIEEELTTLYPYFVRIFDLQSEPNETWLEVVNVLHMTEHVIMSCISSLFVFDHPVWYHMASLSNVYDKIKVVRAKLEMIKWEDIINNPRCLPSSVGYISKLGEINEIFVGFEDEKEKIIHMLTRGSLSRDIVSIVGMGGIGKTTLARQVFELVKGHFDVFAFCSISLDHNPRRLLLDIIRGIKGDVAIDNGMTNDDLADQLRKCLSRKSYLIVLDDIWNVSAWNELKSSFPNHENGSRVMFTTRSHEVADKCKMECIPHQLRFLNRDESWELLQKKVFHNDISPPYLCEIGKQIATNCKGLALAVVVIGGLLSRTEKSLRWWSKVEQGLAYYLSNEGCMEILDLSYKYLPENLKPCLIYVGAFPKGLPISFKRVIMLWIAEGFVQESKTKSLEDAAKEYFQDLVDRSFIIVHNRSSGGGIKNFHVHDLIHELCQTKCRDGNFFQLNHDIASSSSSNTLINNHYRVSIQKESDVAIVAGSSLSDTRSLLIFCKNLGYEEFPFRKLGLVQMLDLGDLELEGNDINELTSLIHLRHIDATIKMFARDSIPSSISNLWNITSLTLRLGYHVRDECRLPETLWRMKSLMYVNVENCILKFSDDDDVPNDQILDKVVSFSRPILSTGKDVKRLLQRLLVVRKLSCIFGKTADDYEESIKTLDFHRELESPMLIGESAFPHEESIETLDFDKELESLKLTQDPVRRQRMINFPSTLKKLTLEWFLLPSIALSAIAELHGLQVLKLSHNSFGEPKLETEDLKFRNLKFFRLVDYTLEEWNASTESFPCLEQLVIDCRHLGELPPCFGEMPTLKRIAAHEWSREVQKSALRIQEEVMELGIQLEVSTWNWPHKKW